MLFLLIQGILSGMQKKPKEFTVKFWYAALLHVVCLKASSAY